MYSKRVKSRPYDEVSATIKAVAKPLLETGDEYHITHTARLACTLEVLYREGVAEGGRVLELGTTGFFPIAVESLFPGVAIDVTNFDGAWALIESFVKDPVSQVVCELAGKSATVTAFSIDLEYDVIPAEDETYDVVLCCEVLEHISRLVIIQVNQNGGHDLRVLITQQFGYREGIHPLQTFNA